MWNSIADIVKENQDLKQSMQNMRDVKNNRVCV